MLFAAGAGVASHAEEIPYAVASEPWPSGLGDHRAVVRVEDRADAVAVSIPWRRRDPDPDRKLIIVADAATGKRVANVVPLSVQRESGSLAFEPATVPGDYHVYYLPYPPQAGWGGYGGDYLPPQETADAGWRQRLPADTSALPRAAVLRFEARSEFDSLHPMEVVATAAETNELVARSPQPYLLFPEDRRHPIRMTGDLPVRWVRGGPSGSFRGEALRGEYYAFQIGVYAARQPLEDISVDFDGPCAAWITCFNLGGVSWDGVPFRKTVSVPRGKVRALWFGVDVPRSVRPGENTATVTIRPKNAPPSTVAVTLRVMPEELADRGDSEPWRHSRLRWLDSTSGFDDEVVAPYTPLRVSGTTIRCLGREVTLAPSGLPASIRCGGHELLAAPVLFAGAVQGGLRFTKRTAGTVEWESGGVRGRMEFDGHLDFAVTVKTPCDPALEIPFRREAVPYLMGIGRRGGARPAAVRWDWQGPYDSFWIGDVPAGLHCELRGGSYHGPMLNLYHPAPPATWHNGGKGGVTVADADGGRVVARAFSGPRELAAGRELTFEFALLVTPVKPLDTARHFRERYYHSVDNIPPGVNVINVHHATPVNPYINYPFLTVEKMQEFCRSWQARGARVKIYYTVRELTSRLPELWALRSLGDEVLAGGGAGGFPWLREHLVNDYTPQWYTQIQGGGVDAAILTSGASRWYNYYIEGLGWLVKNVPIDGLYLDDVTYDRTILKRMRKVMERSRPGCLIDLHSNTGFSIGPANQYAEFFPYVDRLWFGESFDYEAMPPDQWLVEVSGIPFGLMGDMLQDGGNRWRGMVYGMTARLPWTGAADPRPVWKIWDEFGIAQSRMTGYWETSCPVRADRDDVLATVYAKEGRALVAVASWAPAPVAVRLRVDWAALGLDRTSAKVRVPPIPGFQAAQADPNLDALPVEPGKGWLIELAAE